MRPDSTLVGAFTVAALLLARAPSCWAQVEPPPASSSPSTDLFVMLGPDLDRPGAVAKANYNVGVGHTFAFLKKDPIGDEITVAYTYENAGPGFWHSALASDTESAGIMKNFALPRTERVTGYTWVQIGLTTFTGAPSVHNRFYDGESVGAIVHFNGQNAIWIQETYNKIVTVPWYTTTSFGYTWSW